ncbi:hypothetical protein [Paraflavitalea speifideaquila]|uniref:hypothetical protein n=1 Tax=Paraflavitalea speifideaquila TaxID=3076558 RepID=UPI0028E8F1DC|nr:hypothetical protein [Paraflavitalea speifideiaquila]
MRKVGLTVANYNRPGQCYIPYLRFFGKWMHDAGFVEDTYAKFISIKGMLIIIPGAPPPPHAMLQPVARQPLPYNTSSCPLGHI